MFWAPAESPVRQATGSARRRMLRAALIACDRQPGKPEAATPRQDDAWGLGCLVGSGKRAR